MSLASYKQKLAELKKVRSGATPVVQWYAHPEDLTIRGPYNRWLRVNPDEHSRELIQNGRTVRAWAGNDIQFFATAANEWDKLISDLESCVGALEFYSKKENYEYNKMETENYMWNDQGIRASKCIANLTLGSGKE